MRGRHTERLTRWGMTERGSERGGERKIDEGDKMTRTEGRMRKEERIHRRCQQGEEGKRRTDSWGIRGGWGGGWWWSGKKGAFFIICSWITDGGSSQQSYVMYLYSSSVINLNICLFRFINICIWNINMNFFFPPTYICTGHTTHKIKNYGCIECGPHPPLQMGRVNWWDSSVGSLAESQEVEGTDEPIQAIHLNWKMSPYVHGPSVCSTKARPATFKDSSVVPSLVDCFPSSWFFLVLILFLCFAVAAESFFRSLSLWQYTLYYSIIRACYIFQLKMYTSLQRSFS